MVDTNRIVSVVGNRHNREYSPILRYSTSVLLFGYLIFLRGRKDNASTLASTVFHMRNWRVRNFSRHLANLIAATPNAANYVDDIRQELRSAPSDILAMISVENHIWDIDYRRPRVLVPEVTVDAHGYKDDRNHPVSPGSDYALKLKALSKAWYEGLDESLVLDESGKVIGAISSSILMLKGDMVFHSTHPHTQVSVLEPLTLEFLATHGAHIKARPDGFFIDELLSAEVWLLNATTGVSKVSWWLEYGDKFPVSAKRPVEAVIPAFSEVNDHLWSIAEEV